MVYVSRQECPLHPFKLLFEVSLERTNHPRQNAQESKPCSGGASGRNLRDLESNGIDRCGEDSRRGDGGKDLPPRGG